ncbi:MAG: hypothetical protein RBR43_03755 [Desulfuromonadaceae bacterium]|nr:hypothetical protein [Desulfuromonas sp.]MDY0184983.1 hypothetical protein [Desulfuromonadaceae bacterium]
MAIGATCFVFALILFHCQLSHAAVQAELQELQVEQDVNMIKIVLSFDRVPLYTLATSGQKLEITLLDTRVREEMPAPGDSDSIARVLVGEATDRLLLSFLLRRPPRFVNAHKLDGGKQIVLDVHWREQDSGSRPAISRSLPGGLHVSTTGGVSRKAIASKYQGHWEQFFRDYERAVELNIPLGYTLPPFPLIGLCVPAHECVPLEVLEAGEAERWDVARSAYTGVGFTSLSLREKVTRDLLLAEMALRERGCSNAYGFLARIKAAISDVTGQGNVGGFDFPELEQCLALMELYLRTCSPGQFYAEQPHVLLAELELAVAAHTALAQQPYVTLLQAEAELALGRSEVALQLLGTLDATTSEMGSVVTRRRADALYKRGDFEAALKLYAELDAAEELGDFAYSLGSYASTLYARKEYLKAQEVFSHLHDLLEDQEQRDMARYFIAMSMLHAENTDSALNLLGKIMPGSYAAKLAKLKLADLSAVSPRIESREQALSDYATLLNEMPTRAGRAEVEFKQALTHHLLHHAKEAVATLRHFLTIDRISPLRVYAQALLAEILPPYIEELVAEQQHFDAMLLVEQHREILVSTQRNYAFLLNLGKVFSELEFYARAVKLYEYVLDATKQVEKLEPVYSPLIRALYEQGNYRNVVTYARRYLEQFRDGDIWYDEMHASSVYLDYVMALLKLGRENEADTLLSTPKRPRGAALDRFAARRLWRQNEIIAAGQQLQRIVAENIEAQGSALGVDGGALAEDVYIYAESLYAQKQLAAALEYYQRLVDTSEYGLASMYRMGSILIEQGERSRGRLFLSQVAESAETDINSRWKRLAQQSLEIERFD